MTLAAFGVLAARVDMGNSIPETMPVGWQNPFNRTLMKRTICSCVMAVLANARGFYDERVGQQARPTAC
jgi:hypothetical protein